ncbi:hypothetical protein FBU30_002043 [Linnemannia zychae]|nr:hypothetical protein FBU30_002043 [Linnemannia zychae]
MTSETNSQQHLNSRFSPSARLSYSDFEAAIKAFLHQTRHHSPWCYVEYLPRRGQPLQGYLTLTQLVHSHQANTRTPSAMTDANISQVSFVDQLLLDEMVEQLDEIPDGEENDQTEHDTASIVDLAVNNSTDTTLDFLSVNYHIVFSPSYQVPILYFNAYRPDGAAITLEEIYESLVPEEWRSTIRNAGLNGGISQQDHPVLNTPYFYMHPCETVALMETVFQNNNHATATSIIENYIVTWLSFTGQAIGITVPTEMVIANSTQ